MHRNLARRDVGVDLVLALLPAFGPEPALVGRNRQRCPQLKNPVVAFSDLNLGAGLVEVQAPPNVRGQCHDAARLDSNIPMESHTHILPSQQICRKTVLLQYGSTDKLPMNDLCAAPEVFKRYINRHLLDGAVTPAAIAAAHWVSIRTVNRVFSATGQTVGEVVRARRLARARAEVTATDRPISVIAQRWGFSDTSHFSRTFKAHYGYSPTDYRNAYPQRPAS
jgi:AraC-like DNA-binding protein